MNFFTAIVSFTCFVLIVYVAWGFLTFKKWRKNESDPVDAKYYELKSRNEFLLACFAVFIAVASYFGYTTIENIKSSLRNEISEAVTTTMDSLNYLQGRVNSTLSDVDTASFHLGKYEQRLQSMLANQDILEGRIRGIEGMEVLQKDFYRVDGLTFSNYELHLNKEFKRIHFSDLTTVKGEKLPSTSEPPFVMVSAMDGGIVSIIDVTNKYVDLNPERTTRTVAVDHKPDTTIMRYNLLLYY